MRETVPGLLKLTVDGVTAEFSGPPPRHTDHGLDFEEVYDGEEGDGIADDGMKGAGDPADAVASQWEAKKAAQDAAANPAPKSFDLDDWYRDQQQVTSQVGS